MKRQHLVEFTPEAHKIVRWHLSMIGKPTEAEITEQVLNAIVRNNPQFEGYLDIEETLQAFFNAIHYGSLELKNLTLSAHCRALNDFIRITKRGAGMREGQKGEKPEGWTYNPEEPLPDEITKQRALDVLNTIKRVSPNIFDPYNKTGAKMDKFVIKLIERAHE